MAREWTPQQKQALEHNGTLTVISAAAGSGKTTVLVEKALRIILDEKDKVSADRLLIVTFSNASAKEFKNRIEKAINKQIKQNPENQYIKSQKIALQKADISTIHSFCIKLVRENFEILDIAPDFTICDDATSMILHQKAIDLAMEYGYQKEDFKKFVKLFGKSSQDTQIKDFLKDMFYYFSALPFPRKRAIELAQKATQEKFEKSQVYCYLWQDIGQQIDYMQYLVERIEEIVTYADIDAYEQGVLENKNKVKLLKQAYQTGESYVIKSIASEGAASLGRLKKGTASEYTQSAKVVYETLKSTFQDIKEDIEYLDENKYYTQIRQTQKYIDAITDVFVFYYDTLLQLKKQEKSFEFSDFEHFAVQLLIDENSNSTELAKTLQERYVKIMEDEFQDTSYVQDMIFKTISKEKESNLFVVGDVKQSIYGFRKASPEILLEKRARQETQPGDAKTIVLANNFRSEVNVIKSINFIFERIMSKAVGGVDYISGEQLVPSHKKVDNKKPGATILIADDTDGEAKMVASKIYSMVNGGFEIEEEGVRRAVNYGDFCILLRNKKRFSEFEKELKEIGIPTFVKDDKPLLEKPEIQSIISLLKVINNPFQDVYLTATMFGDIFTFTLDELLQIRVINQKQNLYKLLSTSKQDKAKDFLEQLKDFSFVAKIYSPDKLVDYIINKTGYYTKLAFLDGGDVKRENIRRFISFAKKYTKAYQNYLGDFLRYIDLCIETGKGADENLQRPDNTVAIMTNHTSKGLEFPICFVSGLGTPFNKQDRSKRLMIDPIMGMATYANESFGYNKSTAGINAIRKKILSENANDEMRLLYVAFTRAKNYLFLTAQYTNLFTPKTISKIADKNSMYPHQYAVKKANTPMEWVIMGYLPHKVFNSYKVIKENVNVDTFLDFKVISLQEDEQTKEKTQLENNRQNVGEIVFDADKAKENLNAVYSDINKTLLPIKMAVSDITKQNIDIDLRKPSFIEQSTGAVQKGTQMHKFVQYADILLARTNLENELQRLIGDGVVDENLIDIKQLQDFINSEIASIIVNGDKVYKEKEFLVPYSAQRALNNPVYAQESIMLQGVIDCVVIAENKIYVIDYKTDKVKNVNVLYERYKDQLELYRIAASYLFDSKEIECIIYSFHLGQYVRF